MPNTFLTDTPHSPPRFKKLSTPLYKVIDILLLKSTGESSSTGTGGGGLGFHTNLLERQGSIQGRERMIAHSTALESITAEVDSMSIGNTPCNTTGNAGNVISQVQITLGKELLCVGISRLNSRTICTY